MTWSVSSSARKDDSIRECIYTHEVMISFANMVVGSMSMDWRRRDRV